MTSPNQTSKPDSPAEVDKRSWKFVVRRTIRAFGTDSAPDIAASLTFYAILAMVPATMVSFSVVSLLGRAEETADIVLDVVRALVPDAPAAPVQDVIAQIAEARLAGTLLVLAIGLMLWAVARYVAALGRGMNRIYRVEEGRAAWKLKAGQLLISLVVIVCIAVAAVILAVSGDVSQALGDAFGLGEMTLLIWRIARWPLLAAVVIFILAFLYYFAPNVKPSRFRWMSLGAAVALAVLLLASLAFGLYASNFADYDRLYGAFGGIIVFALWLWIANMAILVGAEFDAEVERVRELQAGIPAETQLQVPLRDASGIARTVRQDRKDAAEARKIRK